MINKTEQEITKNWKQDNQIMVSINCVTYNHEDFIGEALDSFLMQDTDFAFEILIHDDVSTDKTVDIIKKYEKKFPNIIKPIYQKINQFSQGISPMSFLLEKVKGKYVAFCDGDDYWIDNQKLKIQIEEMEKYSDINMSFHPVYELSNGKREEILSKHKDKNKIFSTSEIILGGGEFCPTSSLVFRSQSLLNLPYIIKNMIPGDYPLQILNSVNGGALYINRCMSIYRKNNIGSWSNSMKQCENGKKFLERSIKSLEILDNELKYKYSKEIENRKKINSWRFLTYQGCKPEREKVYLKIRKSLNIKQKILWHLIYSNTSFHKFLVKIKYKILVKM